MFVSIILLKATVAQATCAPTRNEIELGDEKVHALFVTKRTDGQWQCAFISFRFVFQLSREGELSASAS